MSVYNEEKTLENKLNSLLSQTNLNSETKIYIGSDASTDRSNQIIRSFIDKNGLDSKWHFFEYSERRGKASVVNKLLKEITKTRPVASDHILILTDANVLMEEDVIHHLQSGFNDPGIGLVDSYMINLNPKDTGVAPSESFYISAEGALKYREGQIWKSTIGPFGGCYAIRSIHYTPIPTNYKVDDFFLAMNVFQNGQGAIVQKKAKVYEKVSTEIGEEFKRKRRIAAGNFQNMKRFRTLWWPVRNQLSFSIFSHKILRWMSPQLFLFMLLTSAALSVFAEGFFANLLTLKLVLFGLILLIGKLGILLGIRVPIISRLYYFVMMNIALFAGYIDYLKGIRSGVWEPPKRI
jgi:glycosyltransferase involved in cell wall biosynthesis